MAATATLLPVLTSDTLALSGIRHGFFTRQGGVSSGLYASLNAGRGSGDDPDAVTENRRRVAAAMAVEPASLLGCWQSHSVITRVADGAWGDARPEGDAIVTATPGLGCTVLTADCAPVLLADPHARVIGAAHAGWQGALNGVVSSVVSAMRALGAEPKRIQAAVGPCIGPNSYEVGPEFLERFAHHDAGSERFFRPARSADKFMFDLPGFVLLRLAETGVTNARWIGRDTCTDETLFFSNRRAHKRGESDYGRLIACIALS